MKNEVVKGNYDSKTGLWTILVSVGGVVIPVVGYNWDLLCRLVARVFGIAY